MTFHKPILIALSWGHRNPEPGLTNEAMARLIISNRDQFSLVLVQHEIGTAMKRLGHNPYMEVFDHRIPDAYLNTKEVIDQIVEFMKQHNVNIQQSQFATLTYYIHTNGVRWMLKQHGIKPVMELTVKIADPQSHQWFGRSIWQARVYKLWAGLKYFLKR